jgi:hypothetical protein
MHLNYLKKIINLMGTITCICCDPEETKDLINVSTGRYVREDKLSNTI